MSDSDTDKTKKKRLTLSIKPKNVGGESKLGGQIIQRSGRNKSASVVEVVTVKKKRSERSADANISNAEQQKKLELLKKAALEEEEQRSREEEKKQQLQQQQMELENAAQEVEEEKVEPVEVVADIPAPAPIIEERKDTKHKKSKVQEEKKSSDEELESDDQPVKKASPVPEKKKVVTKQKSHEERRSSSKLTLQDVWKEETQEERIPSLASLKRKREKEKKQRMGISKEVEKVYREVILPETITVQELANRMTERVTNVVRELMKLGVMAKQEDNIDADTAEVIIQTFGHKFKRVQESDIENVLDLDDEDDSDSMQQRPPIVTIMGHVDHGKTSLLDALRSTDVAAGESGGITQHIGAYQIELESKDKISFLDTPGHEAFTAMRSRGAKVTDIVVIVVAADDGIMAQTIEAINHAKAAEVPIIIAINKIDKPAADVARVKNELFQHELVLEEFGGDIQAVEVSAKERLNLDKLVESILLQAEILELKANQDRKATGAVIESKLERGKGVVTSLMVQKGTLAIGDIIIAGTKTGRVRAMHDDKGVNIAKAGPSTPVEILGLSETPEAGDKFDIVENDKQAREIAEFRDRKSKEQKVVKSTKNKLEDLFKQGGLKELPIIIKGDVKGSIEAIIGSLEKIESDEVRVKILHGAVGAITESDISLAQASGALILGFNVRANVGAKQLAEEESIDLRYYNIIYNLIDDVKAVLGGMLDPILREEYIGTVSIRQVFNISKVGKIAGCMVTDGLVKRGSGVRLLRDNIVIHEGKLKTLKRFKDEVKEVQKGYECGIAFESYDDIKESDTVEVFEIIEEQKKL